jgi:1-acyl-sn-glycerol-3-phosphate acyltransferase
MPRRRKSGVTVALQDLAGAFLPLRFRRLQGEIEERLRKIPNNINEYGFDSYGLSPEWIRRRMLPGALLYKNYFRVETHDIDRLPQGAYLLISNHAGQLPFDGAMLAMALLLEADPPRIVRAMGEFWIPRLPFLNVALARGGSLVGTPDNCLHMLESGEVVMVFPEGVRGMNKTWDQRYKLQRFGLGFMRLALDSAVPIVPVAIVGSDDQQIAVANARGLGDLLGMPALPITLTFPWLGPLGLLPMPVKYRIYFGEPLRFEGDPGEEDAAIQRKVDVVRGAIQSMLEHGRRERRGIFS